MFALCCLLCYVELVLVSVLVFRLCHGVLFVVLCCGGVVMCCVAMVCGVLSFVVVVLC